MGGTNDAMDYHSCLHAMETTLRTGIIYASVHGNTKNSRHHNLSLTGMPALRKIMTHASPEQSEFPANVMQILNQDIIGKIL